MKTKSALNGCPGTEGRDGNKQHALFAATPSMALAEELHRRATQPYRGSAELRRVLRECEAVRRSQAWPSEARLSRFDWNPRLVAWLIALLIAVGTMVWAGCEAGTRLGGMFAKRNSDIAAQLGE